MRTKTLLLTAALTVAAAATSMAQAVYSVNIVGYINLTLRPGFNLVANQLNASPNNLLGSVVATAPEEAQILKFSGGNYTSDIFLGGSWLNATTGDPSVTTVAPGEGFFFFNPGATDAPVTLVGEVKTGASTVTIPPVYSLLSSVVPQEISLTPANGFPEVEEMQYLTFNAATQTYNTSLIYLGGAWLNSITGDPADARPTVGQGFFIFNPDATSKAWTRNFTP